MDDIVYSESKWEYHSSTKNGDINLESVLEFAKAKHFGQKRKGGEDYIAHPLRVAETVKKYKGYSSHLDLLLAAALLHDVFEDTYTSYREVEDAFGKEVASLVLEVTTAPVATKIFGKRDYLLTKMKSMTPYALFIKLADRLDNITDLKGTKVEWRVQYFKQTEYIIEHLKNEIIFSPAQKPLVKEIEKVLSAPRNW